jgi:hypothetical protein
MPITTNALKQSLVLLKNHYKEFWILSLKIMLIVIAMIMLIAIAVIQAGIFIGKFGNQELFQNLQTDMTLILTIGSSILLWVAWQWCFTAFIAAITEKVMEKVMENKPMVLGLFARLKQRKVRQAFILLVIASAGSIFVNFIDFLLKYIAPSHESMAFLGASILLIILVFLLVMYVTFRISLSAIGILANDAKGIGQAWRLSKGHAFKVFLVILQVSLFFFLLALPIIGLLFFAQNAPLLLIAGAILVSILCLPLISLFILPIVYLYKAIKKTEAV